MLSGPGTVSRFEEALLEEGASVYVAPHPQSAEPAASHPAEPAALARQSRRDQAAKAAGGRDGNESSRRMSDHRSGDGRLGNPKVGFAGRVDVVSVGRAEGGRTAGRCRSQPQFGDRRPRQPIHHVRHRSRVLHENRWAWSTSIRATPCGRLRKPISTCSPAWPCSPGRPLSTAGCMSRTSPPNGWPPSDRPWPASHESNNDLLGIQLGLKMLAKKITDRPDEAEIVMLLSKHQQHLQQVFDEVQSYAAPINLERLPVSVNAIWRQAWQQLEQCRADRKAELVETTAGVNLRCASTPFDSSRSFATSSKIHWRLAAIRCGSKSVVKKQCCTAKRRCSSPSR